MKRHWRRLPTSSRCFSMMSARWATSSARFSSSYRRARNSTAAAREPFFGFCGRFIPVKWRVSRGTPVGTVRRRPRSSSTTILHAWSRIRRGRRTRESPLGVIPSATRVGMVRRGSIGRLTTMSDCRRWRTRRSQGHRTAKSGACSTTRHQAPLSVTRIDSESCWLADPCRLAEPKFPPQERGRCLSTMKPRAGIFSVRCPSAVSISPSFEMPDPS